VIDRRLAVIDMLLVLYINTTAAAGSACLVNMQLMQKGEYRYDTREDRGDQGSNKRSVIHEVE
jgi:hypothetical protein